jgi:hypothetical protein
VYIAGKFIKPLYLALIAVVLVGLTVTAAFSLRPERTVADQQKVEATPSASPTLGGEPASNNTGNDRPKSTEDESELIRPMTSRDLQIDFPFLQSAKVQEIRPKDLDDDVAYVYAMHPEDWNLLLPKYRVELKNFGFKIDKETAVEGGAGVTIDVSNKDWNGQVFLRSAPSDVDDRSIIIGQFKKQ